MQFCFRLGACVLVGFWRSFNLSRRFWTLTEKANLNFWTDEKMNVYLIFLAKCLDCNF